MKPNPAWTVAAKAAAKELHDDTEDDNVRDLCDVALYGFMKKEPHWRSVDWGGKQLRQPGAIRAVLSLLQEMVHAPLSGMVPCNSNGTTDQARVQFVCGLQCEGVRAWHADPAQVTCPGCKVDK